MHKKFILLISLAGIVGCAHNVAGPESEVEDAGPADTGYDPDLLGNIDADTSCIPIADYWICQDFVDHSGLEWPPGTRILEYSLLCHDPHINDYGYSLNPINGGCQLWSMGGGGIASESYNNTAWCCAALPPTTTVLEIKTRE